MRDFVVRSVACPTWFPGSLCLAIQDGGDSDVGLPKKDPGNAVVPRLGGKALGDKVERSVA